jgi:hypothetical protein
MAVKCLKKALFHRQNLKLGCIVGRFKISYPQCTAGAA